MQVEGRGFRPYPLGPSLNVGKKGGRRPLVHRPPVPRQPDRGHATIRHRTLACGVPQAGIDGMADIRGLVRHPAFLTGDTWT